MAPECTRWLTSVFVQAVRETGASASDDAIKEEAQRVMAAWSDPARTCHNTKYLMKVLDTLDELAECAHSPEELQVAAFYHGVVFYAPRRLDYVHAGRDYAASANVAATQLPLLGVPDDAIGRIVSLIERAAIETQVFDDVDGQVFHDALLGTLLMAPQDYRDYRARMVGEYSHLPKRLYLLGRRRQVRALLDQPALFISPLAEDEDAIARSNLEAELARLNQELGDAEKAEAAATDPVTSSGPASGTIVIKKVKAKLRAAAATTGDVPKPEEVKADEPATAEPTADAAPRPLPEPEPVEDEVAQDVSSLEAIEDDLDAFSGTSTADDLPAVRETHITESIEED